MQRLNPIRGVAALVLVLVGHGRESRQQFVEPTRLLATAEVSMAAMATKSLLELWRVSRSNQQRQNAAGGIEIVVPILNETISSAALAGLPYLSARKIGTFRRPSLSRQLAGLALLTYGLGLILTALDGLGEWFTPELVVRPGQPLMQSGPYRHIRHPFYAGYLASYVGYSLIYSSWVGLLFVLGALPAVLHRIRAEESLMLEEYGDAYRKMMASTARLLPKVL